MIINLVLMFIGIYAVSKQVIKISAKRAIIGRPAKRIGYLFITTAALGEIVRFSSDLSMSTSLVQIANMFYIAGFAISILLTIYLVFSKKGQSTK